MNNLKSLSGWIVAALLVVIVAMATAAFTGVFA